MKIQSILKIFTVFFWVANHDSFLTAHTVLTHLWFFGWTVSVSRNIPNTLDSDRTKGAAKQNKHKTAKPKQVF